MSKPMEKNDLPHRDAESIKEKVKHAESIVVLCHDSIRLHDIPEVRHVADVLLSLFQPLWEAANDAEALEALLYKDFLASKETLSCQVAKGGEA